VEEARLIAFRGDVRAALALLEAVAEDRSVHLPALLLAGGLALEEREHEVAMSFYLRACDAAPGSAEAWNGLARCLHALARNLEALAAAERARELLREGDNFRHVTSVHLTLLWCLRDLRRHREALALAEEALARTPDAVLAHWAGVVEAEMADSEKDRC
jgi:tetratricopeptide (TPR) repeat protein